MPPVVGEFRDWVGEIGKQNVRADICSGDIDVPVKHGADLLFVQLGTDTSEHLEQHVPSWNIYNQEHIQTVEKLAQCVLNPDGVVVIVHNGGILHSTAILDTFGADGAPWALPETITIWNDTPHYVKAGRRMVSEVVDVHLVHCCYCFILGIVRTTSRLASLRCDVDF